MSFAPCYTNSRKSSNLYMPASLERLWLQAQHLLIYRLKNGLVCKEVSNGWTIKKQTHLFVIHQINYYHVRKFSVTIYAHNADIVLMESKV